MGEKRYFFSSYPTSYLISLLEQKTKEVLKLKNDNIEKNSILISNRIFYLNFLIKMIKECVTERYLEEKMTLTKCGVELLSSMGIKKEIMQDVFTTKAINNNELIDLGLLHTIIDHLDIDHLQQIIDNKDDTIYAHYAKQRFDELLFMVDEEVKKELELKMKKDNGR